MSYVCNCKSTGVTYQTQDCQECARLCGNQEMECYNQNQTIMGVPNGVFIALFVIQLFIWVIMILFSLAVMKKCGGNPTWLNPTIITILFLWILFGWIPGLGFIMFVFLLVLLIVFSMQCNGRNGSGKQVGRTKKL